MCTAITEEAKMSSHDVFINHLGAINNGQQPAEVACFSLAKAGSHQRKSISTMPMPPLPPSNPRQNYNFHAHSDGSEMCMLRRRTTDPLYIGICTHRLFVWVAVIHTESIAGSCCKTPRVLVEL